MKNITLFIFSILLLSGCGTAQEQNFNYFVLGKWKGEFAREINNKNTLTTYEVEFLPFNILLLDIDRPEESVHDLRFSYKFVTSDRIRIEGRIENEIQVKNDHNDLIIIGSDQGLPPSGRYKKVLSRLDRLLILLIFLLSLLAVLIYKRKSKRKSTTNQAEQKS